MKSYLSSNRELLTITRYAVVVNVRHLLRRFLLAMRRALTPPAQRLIQHGVVTLEPFAAEARFGPRGNADALGDHSPDLHLLLLPPGNRYVEVVRAQSRGANHDTSRCPSGD